MPPPQDKPALSLALATAISRVEYRDLPASTRAATGRAITDGIGVMLAASGLSADIRPFVAFARAHAAAGPATIIGCTEGVSATAAALANGAMAHALDFEDAFDAATLHPNASLLPALMALAQLRRPVSGEEFVTAVAIGCDVACRLGLSLRQRLEVGGWYPPPIIGAFGAVAGAARLLRLEPARIVDALSLLLCQNSCPGEIRHAPDSIVRAVREAFPAQAAVTCALLAEAGIRGFSAPLEGAEGFYRLFAGGHYEPSALLEGLGHRFWIEQLSFKKWPCCRGTHAYIEAIQALRKRRQFRRHEVMLVQASGGDAQRMLCEPADSKRQPRTLIDARFSIPFAIACALAHDEVTLASFTAQTLHDPQLLALAARVQFSYRPDWPEDGTAAGAVSLQLADGSRESLRVAHAVGHPGNPLSDQELIDKFVLGATLAAPQRKPADVRAYARSLLELHHSKDVAAEFSWLGVDAGAPML